MKATKLVSVRIDEDVLAKIDQLANKSTFRKRSDIINAALRLIAFADNSKIADKACQFWPQFGDVIDKFEFEYHREHK
jgi:Arc/MetJ-type ribon-helix-helix transcriptional regulator